jgi:hypothetical protein
VSAVIEREKEKQKELLLNGTVEFQKRKALISSLPDLVFRIRKLFMSQNKKAMIFDQLVKELTRISSKSCSKGILLFKISLIILLK